MAENQFCTKCLPPIFFPPKSFMYHKELLSLLFFSTLVAREAEKMNFWCALNTSIIRSCLMAIVMLPDQERQYNKDSLVTPNESSHELIYII